MTVSSIRKLDRQFDNVIQTITGKLNETKNEILEKWEHVGAEDKEDCLNELSRNLQRRVRIFKDIENSYVTEIELNVNNLNESIKTICKQLGQPDSEYLSFNGNLINKLSFYKQSFQKLNLTKTNLENQYKTLKDEESTMLERLEMKNDDDSPDLRFNCDGQEDVLKIETIKKFVKHNDNLKIKIENRENLLNNIKSRYIDILSTLTEVPDESDTFAKQFVYANEFYIVSDNYVTLAKDLETKVVKMLNDRKFEIELKCSKIVAIIEKLKLPSESFESTRLNFDYDENSHNDFINAEPIPNVEDLSSRNLEIVSKQLEKLNILKLEKLDEIINTTDIEIDELNLKCYLNGLDILKFSRGIEKCEDKEEKLELMEKRVDKLNKFYTQNLEIFTTINKWNEAFDELKDIERKEKDTSRLFKNRGGSLLAEMKKKKKINSRVIKLERQLQTYQSENGEDAITLHGFDISEYITDKYQRVEDDRSYEREAKKNERKCKNVEESRFGVNSSRLKKRARGACNSPSKRIKSHQSSYLGKNLTVSTESSCRSTPSDNHRTESKFKQPLSSNRFNNQTKPPSAKTLPSLKVKANKSNNSTPKTSIKNLNSHLKLGLKLGELKEIPKMSKNRRRSKTPERLQSCSKLRGFSKLPSEGGRFGFRRRSKSVTTLSNIIESSEFLIKKNTISDDSVLSSEDFKEKFYSSRNNAYPLASSFISTTP